MSGTRSGKSRGGAEKVDAAPVSSEESTSLSPASRVLAMADKLAEDEMRAYAAGDESSEEGTDDSIGPGSTSNGGSHGLSEVGDLMAEGASHRALRRGYIQERRGRNKQSSIRHRALPLGSPVPSEASSEDSWRQALFDDRRGSPKRTVGGKGSGGSAEAPVASAVLAADAGGEERAVEGVEGADVVEEDVEGMNVAGLKAKAKELGIATTGRKNQLIQRIKSELSSLAKARAASENTGDPAEKAQPNASAVPPEAEQGAASLTRADAAEVSSPLVSEMSTDNEDDTLLPSVHESVETSGAATAGATAENSAQKSSPPASTPGGESGEPSLVTAEKGGVMVEGRVAPGYDTLPREDNAPPLEERAALREERPRDGGGAVSGEDDATGVPAVCLDDDRASTTTDVDRIVGAPSGFPSGAAAEEALENTKGDVGQTSEDEAEEGAFGGKSVGEADGSYEKGAALEGRREATIDAEDNQSVVNVTPPASDGASTREAHAAAAAVEAAAAVSVSEGSTHVDDVSVDSMSLSASGLRQATGEAVAFGGDTDLPQEDEATANHARAEVGLDPSVVASEHGVIGPGEGEGSKEGGGGNPNPLPVPLSQDAEEVKLSLGLPGGELPPAGGMPVLGEGGSEASAEGLQATVVAAGHDRGVDSTRSADLPGGAGGRRCNEGGDAAKEGEAAEEEVVLSAKELVEKFLEVTRLWGPILQQQDLNADSPPHGDANMPSPQPTELLPETEAFKEKVKGLAAWLEQGFVVDKPSKVPTLPDSRKTGARKVGERPAARGGGSSRAGYGGLGGGVSADGRGKGSGLRKMSMSSGGGRGDDRGEGVAAATRRSRLSMASAKARPRGIAGGSSSMHKLSRSGGGSGTVGLKTSGRLSTASTRAPRLSVSPPKSKFSGTAATAVAAAAAAKGNKAGARGPAAKAAKSARLSRSGGGGSGGGGAGGPKTAGGHLSAAGHSPPLSVSPPKTKLPGAARGSRAGTKGPAGNTLPNRNPMFRGSSPPRPPRASMLRSAAPKPGAAVDGTAPAGARRAKRAVPMSRRREGSVESVGGSTAGGSSSGATGDGTGAPARIERLRNNYASSGAAGHRTSISTASPPRTKNNSTAPPSSASKLPVDNSAGFFAPAKSRRESLRGTSMTPPKSGVRKPYGVPTSGSGKKAALHVFGIRTSLSPPRDK